MLIKIEHRSEEILKIYFDNCCYNRPFDDLTKGNNDIEAKAIENLIIKSTNKEVVIYTSSAVDYEMSKIPIGSKKTYIEDVYTSLRLEYIDFSADIKSRADDLQKQNVHKLDAYHIAYAEKANVDYLLTTDKQMRNSGRKSDTKIEIINPLELVMGGAMDE